VTEKVLDCCFMNKLVFQAGVLILSGACCFVAATSILAAESDSVSATNTPAKAAVTATQDSAASPQTTESAQSKLPSNVADVVKLSSAKVSEDVILSYVQNSGSDSALSADDIVQMRKEGVSDRVINAMLDKHSRAMEIVQREAAQAPAAEDSSANSAPPPVVEAASASERPAVVEAPLTPSGSSTYGGPYPAASGAYYGYSGPYYPYYYGGPVVAFGFGYGGCYYGHGIRGVGGIHGGHR
jgi:hypothetical protein